MISLFRRCDEQGRKAIRSFSEKVSKERKDGERRSVRKLIEAVMKRSRYLYNRYNRNDLVG